jgi:hypothetical protein
VVRVRLATGLLPARGGNAHLVLPLRKTLVTAAIEGCHEQQEGCHADDGDDEGHAEVVLSIIWWALVPQLHITDSRLARKGG